MKCPLCGCGDSSILERVSVVELRLVWRKSVGFDPVDDFRGCTEVAYRLCPNCDLRYFDPSIPGGAQFYTQLATREGTYYKSSKTEHAWAAGFVKPGDRVLDVGAGAGQFADVITCTEYVGLELSPYALELAAKRGRTVRLQSVEEHANDRPAYYDCVCAFQVLEHIADVASFVRGCIACCSENGTVVFSVPAHDSFLSILCNNSHNLPPHHMTHWSAAALRAVASQFPVTCETVHQHRCDDTSLLWAAEAIAQQVGCAIARNPSKLVDTGLRGRIIRKLSGYFAPPIAQGLRRANLVAAGPYISAVYRRRDSPEAWAASFASR